MSRTIIEKRQGKWHVIQLRTGKSLANFVDLADAYVYQDNNDDLRRRQATMSDAEVKTQLENNADTNTVTDAEKAYLQSPPDTSEDITSSAVVTDHSVIRGDGGNRKVQDTGLLIDDSDNLTIPAAAALKTNTINETTTNAGVRVDQVLLKDGTVDGIDVGGLLFEPSFCQLSSTDTTTNFNTTPWNTVDWDVQDFVVGSDITHSTSTNPSRINIDTTGKYYVQCYLKWTTANNWVDLQMRFRKDGSTAGRALTASGITRVGTTSNDEGTAFCFEILDFSSTGYFEVQAQQASNAGTINLDTGDSILIVKRMD